MPTCRKFQFSLCDQDTGEVVAQGRTVPCWWDGTDEGLSSGVDETLQAAFATLDAGESANTLCAMAAEIPPDSRGRGLARTILEAMSAIAEAAGLEHLMAPVRPSMKDRYPITPIERYVTWRRGDGRLFDPWMRVHETLGARVGPTIPHSLGIAGTVSEWESWTGLAFPDSGEFVFPEGLARGHRPERRRRYVLGAQRLGDPSGSKHGRATWGHKTAVAITQ